MRMLLAHGLGDAGDLPLELPVVLFLVAGGVLGAAALADRSGPPTEAGPGRPLPHLTAFADATATRAVLRGLALAGLAVVVVTAMLGPPQATTNPAPRTVFVLFWGLLVPVSLLLGPLWRVANPFRSLAAGLARIAGDPEHRDVRPLPEGLGVWPAVALLAVFVWAERNAAQSAGSILLLVLLITAVELLAVNRWGPGWFRHGDPFEAVAEAIASAAPLGRGPDGLLVVRRPRLAHARLRRVPGMPALLGVLIAAHLGDFALDTPLWHEWRAPLPPGGQVGLDTVTLLAVAGVAVAAIRLATRRAVWLLGAFVPVAAGYAIAHDLGVLVVEGQLAVIQLSDPLGRGWDLLGLSGRYVPAEPVPAGIIAALVVLALLIGHIGGVLVGRDAARRRHEPRVAAALQLPLRGILAVSAVLAVALRLTVE